MKDTNTLGVKLAVLSYSLRLTLHPYSANSLLYVLLSRLFDVGIHFVILKLNTICQHLILSHELLKVNGYRQSGSRSFLVNLHVHLLQK